jgi:hypothetical protein
VESRRLRIGHRDSRRIHRTRHDARHASGTEISGQLPAKGRIGGLSFMHPDCGWPRNPALRIV